MAAPPYDNKKQVKLLRVVIRELRTRLGCIVSTTLNGFDIPAAEIEAAGQRCCFAEQR
jgi:hypothetical protein